MGVDISGVSYQPFKRDKLERIVGQISFVDSHTSAGIQLADVCCRTVWQAYEHNKRNRLDQLWPYWNRSNNIPHDPSVVPK